MKTGVNLIGWAKAEQGLGEACRLTANALEMSGIDFSVIDWEMNNPNRQDDITLLERMTDTISYDVSILNLNADQIVSCKKQFPVKIWDTYRIGVWYWELTELPDKWDEAFNLIDEIWAPTKFIQECLQKKAKCPVFHMPPGLKREEPLPEYNRAYFGLPEDAFLFLNMFDFASFDNRKNPEAAIKAFKSAFAPNDMSVGMAIKINSLNPENKYYKKLVRSIKEYRNIYIIPKIMTRQEVNGLLNACDVAVSLHRSEGLGLLCQEAMYYGKPVIATGWSGNMDFMNSENSCLVGYRMIPVDRYYGIENSSALEWADADVDEATGYMKKLYSDHRYREKISEAGKKTIREKFSPVVCGERMEKRLKEIETNIPHRDASEFIESLYADDYETFYSTAALNYWMPIKCSGRFKILKLILKKIVRKFCSPILIPLLEQQNEFNLAVSRLLFKHKQEVERLKEDNLYLKARLAELEKNSEK